MKYQNVYTLADQYSHQFYQLPKILFKHPDYKNLSSDAKLVYALLLDRKELSKKNNWVDDDGQIYLNFTRNNIAEMLGISLKTVIKAFKQLSNAELIIEERTGLNKANKIYVCKPKSLDTQGHVKFTLQEVENLHSSYTDYSDTEKIYNSFSEDRKKEKAHNSFSKGHKKETHALQTVSLTDQVKLTEMFYYDSNFILLLNYYAEKYLERFECDHPKLKENQLNKIKSLYDDIQTEHWLDNEQQLELIDSYFEEKNIGDGNINRLFSGDLFEGKLVAMLKYI